LTGIEMALYKFNQELEQLSLSQEKLNGLTSEALTEREYQIVMAMISGMNNDQICHKMYFSNNTLKYHMKKILSKFDAEHRGEIMQKIIARYMLAS